MTTAWIFDNRVKIAQSGWATFAVMHFNFWKWEGTGNDFILLDQREWLTLPSSEDISAWCNRSTGLGADGVIFFQPSEEVDDQGKCDAWILDYLNADGSRSFCGNGSRALFAFLCGQGWMDEKGGELLACDGRHAVKWNMELGFPAVQLMEVLPPERAPHYFSPMRQADFVDTGSPHHLEWMEMHELDELDVASDGRTIRNKSHYAPDGVNVDFVACSSPNVLQMRTFERGVEDETLACGTGAAAAAISDYDRRGGVSNRTIEMPGGKLVIDLDCNQLPGSIYRNIWLAGPVKQLSQGTWDGAKWLLASLVLFISLSSFNSSLAVDSPSSFWTDSVQVSVLTGSPGSDLYSAWGHTAIRITDWGQTPPADWTYNYGTFQFSEGFYARFMRGQLDYRLAKSPFAAFQKNYMNTDRAILEQVLDITAADARALIDFLEWNHLPENRIYSYKFLYDNCSSRALLALERAWGSRLMTHCEKDRAFRQNATYRQALEPYIKGDPWAEAGIDFILGSRVDEKMPACGSSFLPDGLMAQLQQVELDGRLIAGNPVELLPPQRPWFRNVKTSFWLHPLFYAIVVLLWTLVWTVFRWRLSIRDEAIVGWKGCAGKEVQWLAGALGILLLLMWTATDHQDTWANWNLVWASPILLLIGIAKRRDYSWADWLRAVLALLILIFLVANVFVPQFVSLISTLLAWSVWLSLDPWKWP